MNKVVNRSKLWRVIVSLSLYLTLLTGCIQSQHTSTPVPTSTLKSPTLTTVPTAQSTIAPTPKPQGKTIIVTSPTDGGAGSLRQALLSACSGDNITFDPAIFSPSAPAIIYLTTMLPLINQGNLKIDASNAGVVLDGTNARGEWVVGLEIRSDFNTIRGLQIVNFSGAGINLIGQHNTIGGDRGSGKGPIGQGNLLSGNSDGIGIRGYITAYNTVTGNLIGTDISTKVDQGNQYPGIFIQDGASYNIIGPNNIIAYNDYGIDVRAPDSSGNTITRNSIRDNKQAGIKIQKSANSKILPSVIVNFDLVAGTVTGFAGAYCTVEIFSDSSNEGEIYEGQTIADSSGFFAFSKGASLAGPCLTATATYADGNTTEFSAATSGTYRSISLQKGNNLAKSQFQPKQSKELIDNRIGSMWDLKPWDCYKGDAKTFILSISEIGLKRVRLRLNHGDWPDVDWDKGEYSKFEACANHEEIITGLAENGIQIMAGLVFWDPESRGQKKEEGYSRFKAEDEVQRYLDYVQFVVHNFKDRIEYYEILNEPNIRQGTQQYVELNDYINLVKRVVPVIRQEYPEAKIVVGATAAFREENTKNYLFGILQSDIMPLVDIVSFHPMYGTSPQYDTKEKVFKDSKQYYYNYPILIQEMKETASANGFKGEFLADELCWRTERNPAIYEPWTYSEIVAAKYYTRGTLINFGLGLTVGVAELRPEVIVPTTTVVRNLCTVMEGANPISIPVEIDSNADNIRSYAFSLPNGDKLLAIWTDGVAIDNDPGISTTLTMPSLLAKKVVCIDVLHSFEQEMVTSTVDEDRVIHNLLVKDYPIILRLVP
jgi:parallel beta-helix repeat protein